MSDLAKTAQRSCPQTVRQSARPDEDSALNRRATDVFATSAAANCLSLPVTSSSIGATTRPHGRDCDRAGVRVNPFCINIFER